jgi:hypothetical protein
MTEIFCESGVNYIINIKPNQAVYNEYARNNLPCNWTSIAGVIVSVLASIAVNLGFVPPSCSTKDYKMLYLLLLCYACDIKEEERMFVGWESG